MATSCREAEPVSPIVMFLLWLVYLITYIDRVIVSPADPLIVPLDPTSRCSSIEALEAGLDS